MNPDGLMNHMNKTIFRDSIKELTEEILNIESAIELLRTITNNVEAIEEIIGELKKEKEALKCKLHNSVDML